MTWSGGSGVVLCNMIARVDVERKEKKYNRKRKTGRAGLKISLYHDDPTDASF